MDAISTKIITENGVLILSPSQRVEKSSIAQLKDELKAELKAELKEELKSEIIKQNPATIDEQNG